MGLKTTYYLRSLGVSQVEKSTVKIADHGVTHTRDVVGANTGESKKTGVLSLNGTAKDVSTLRNATQNSNTQTLTTGGAIHGLISLKSAPKIRTVVPQQAEPKLCKIEDPECEACE